MSSPPAAASLRANDLVLRHMVTKKRAIPPVSKSARRQSSYQMPATPELAASEAEEAKYKYRNLVMRRIYDGRARQELIAEQAVRQKMRDSQLEQVQRTDYELAEDVSEQLGLSTYRRIAPMREVLGGGGGRGGGGGGALGRGGAGRDPFSAPTLAQLIASGATDDNDLAEAGGEVPYPLQRASRRRAGNKQAAVVAIQSAQRRRNAQKQLREMKRAARLGADHSTTCCCINQLVLRQLLCHWTLARCECASRIDNLDPDVHLPCRAVPRPPRYRQCTGVEEYGGAAVRRARGDMHE